MAAAPQLSRAMAAPPVAPSHGSLCLAGGLALAQVLFFYVKYLVLFGVPALLMRLDGLSPPPLPRCVSTMFSFTGMWRSVASGLCRPFRGSSGRPAAGPASEHSGPVLSLPSLRPHVALLFFICLNSMMIQAF